MYFSVITGNDHALSLINKSHISICVLDYIENFTIVREHNIRHLCTLLLVLLLHLWTPGQSLHKENMIVGLFFQIVKKIIGRRPHQDRHTMCLLLVVFVVLRASHYTKYSYLWAHVQ